MKKVMIIGLGELGGQAYQLLLNSNRAIKIITADVDEDNGIRKTNLMRYVAGQMGCDCDVEFVKVDLHNVAETANTISKIDPAVIYSAATLQSWWVITALPQEVFDKLDRARFGPWLPMHLTLVYKLMRAVRESGKKPIVINSSFPDVTHNVLSKIGLSPHMGIGNVHNVVQPIRCATADILGVPVQSVTIYLYLAHYVSHYIPRFGNAGGSPYIMKISVDGCAMNNIGHDKIFSELPKRQRRAGGLAGQILTASSAAAIVRAVIANTQELLHSPGVNGLPGGYAVRIGEKGAKVILPDGVDMQDTINANEEGNKYDGIEKILEDGTVVFTDREMMVMRDMIGYECKKMSIDESEERSIELGAKYKEFRAKFK